MAIVIEPYNLQWAINFYALKEVYAESLDGIDCDIQHVGSTSVLGLYAKPILDIDIVVRDAETLKQVIAVLESIGYFHVGDLGIPQREALKRSNESVPYTNTNKQWQKHNLYVCIADCTSLQNHLQLRDYLLANADAVLQYSELKKQLAAQYPNDMNRYVEGKTAFITSILQKTGFSKAELENIIAQNKA